MAEGYSYLVPTLATVRAIAVAVQSHVPFTTTVSHLLVREAAEQHWLRHWQANELAELKLKSPPVHLVVEICTWYRTTWWSWGGQCQNR